MSTPAERARRTSIEDQVLAVLEDAVVPMTSAQVGKRVPHAGIALDRLMTRLAKTGRVTRLQPERRVFWELAPAERDERVAVRAALAVLARGQIRGSQARRGRAGL